MDFSFKLQPLHCLPNLNIHIKPRIWVHGLRALMITIIILILKGMNHYHIYFCDINTAEKIGSLSPSLRCILHYFTFYICCIALWYKTGTATVKKERVKGRRTNHVCQHKQSKRENLKKLKEQRQKAVEFIA